jgi:hypothetical protein
MVKRCPGAALETEFGMGADKTAFGAAHGRKIAKHPHMRRNPETSWMSDPLSIAEQDIRLLLEFSERGEEAGSFAEGKQARDIGEVQPPLRDVLFDRLTGMEIPEDNRGEAVFPVLRESGVQACDKAQRAMGGFDSDAGSQFQLKRASAAWRDAPWMEVRWRRAALHGQG